MTIWAVPSVIFIYSESMAAGAHVRIWSLIYLCGLVCVVVSVVIRALVRDRRGRDAARV